MYLEEEIVKIAKRKNNNKRKYLVVNKIQGKHIPVSPKKALQMFKLLAEKLKKYEGEKLLLIGFAETATAIGAAVAVELNCKYIQTTRETITGVDYIFFSEAHSHATEQKLVKNDIEQIIDNIDRIIFIEDEVTTGNTIKNIITILKNNYKSTINFSVASILNGMDENSKNDFSENNIKIHYLIKTDHSKYEKITQKYEYAENNYKLNENKIKKEYKDIKIKGAIDSRRLINSDKYIKACNNLWEEIKNKEQNKTDKKQKILVLGTEEFMFPALYVANKIEKENNTVYFHATTRSPILESKEKDYPIHKTYELRSFYDKNRVTYVYELDKYDKCYIITDSKQNEMAGKNSIINALESAGNKNIKIIRWC